MKNISLCLVLLSVWVEYSQAVRRPYSRNARIADDDYNGGSDTYGSPPEQPGSSQSGPYPPSGWTPSGDLLLVPGETHSSQQNGYGPPPPPNNQFGPTPPNNQYGPAAPTTESPTTEEPNQEPDASDGSTQTDTPTGENGEYYVLLSDGKLQRVQYSGKQRGRGQYEAQVQYEDVDPIRAPIYSYQNLPYPLTF